MILTVKVWTEDEDKASALVKELKSRCFEVQGPMYTNGYGAPVNHPMDNGCCKSPHYPAPTEGEVDGD